MYVCPYAEACMTVCKLPTACLSLVVCVFFFLIFIFFLNYTLNFSFYLVTLLHKLLLLWLRALLISVVLRSISLSGLSFAICVMFSSWLSTKGILIMQVGIFYARFLLLDILFWLFSSLSYICTYIYAPTIPFLILVFYSAFLPTLNLRRSLTDDLA